jgi:hypothetical protein
LNQKLLHFAYVLRKLKATINDRHLLRKYTSKTYELEAVYNGQKIEKGIYQARLMEQAGRQDAFNLEISDLALESQIIENDNTNFTLILEGKSMDEFEMEQSLREKMETALEQDIVWLQEQLNRQRTLLEKEEARA